MRRQFFTFAIVAIASLNLLSPTSFARLVEIWPYDKLIAESDLVALIEPIENRAAVDSFPDPLGQSKADIAAVDTRFKVHATLKGGAKSLTELTVLHFTYSTQLKIPNGPVFIHFPIEQRMTSRAFGGPERAEGKVYLAFLKRRRDGRFEPVRGQFDSILSFREVREVFDVDVGK